MLMYLKTLRLQRERVCEMHMSRFRVETKGTAAAFSLYIFSPTYLQKPKRVGVKQRSVCLSARDQQRRKIMRYNSSLSERRRRVVPKRNASSKAFIPSTKKEDAITHVESSLPPPPPPPLHHQSSQGAQIVTRREEQASRICARGIQRLINLIYHDFKKKQNKKGIPGKCSRLRHNSLFFFLKK